MTTPHRCDDYCTCQVCGSVLRYWPHGDEHACSNINCINAHGMIIDYWIGPGWTTADPKALD